MNEFAIIILAAGASTRLGEPKQLLQYEGKSLIARLAQAANAVTGKNVIIVTGKLHEEIQAELTPESAILIRNEHWEEGMGSSVAAGIRALQNHLPDISSVILAVCDQPFVTDKTFESLISQAGHDKIIASHYADTIGTPVLFPQKYFKNLLALKGAEGARKLLHLFQDEVIAISFPLGSIDIDTPADYRNWLDR